MYEVFSSGGGTQSACISALIVQGRLPKPDFFVIADTGRERGTTWEYLDAVIRPAMAAIGVEVHRVGHEYAGNYGDVFWKDTLQIPAFSGYQGEKTGKLPGFCSSAWKVNVVTRYLSQKYGITKRHYRRWIGFSCDEWRRVQKMMVGKDYRRGLVRFPLVQDVPLKRHEAIREVERMGWPTPPRSRCFDCPNQADDEWFEVQTEAPEEFALAVERDKEIRKVDPFAWLHESCTPLDTIDFSPEPTLFDPGRYCSSGVCFV